MTEDQCFYEKLPFIGNIISIKKEIKSISNDMIVMLQNGGGKKLRSVMGKKCYTKKSSKK